MDPERWEYGSEFHWTSSTSTLPDAVWPAPCWYGGSGRDALRALLSFGYEKRGWKRLWVPAYFCQEVIEGISHESVTLRAYDDDPLRAVPEFPKASFEHGDAILVVNFFGLRGPLAFDLGIDVIEDHTHAPFSAWARESGATYCMASLRKTLPLPDGGIIWSPQGAALPDEIPPTDIRSAMSRRKLTGMLLKALYLEGHAVEKQAFRDEQIAGERHIAAGAVSGMPLFTRELLKTIPVLDNQRIRVENAGYLRAKLHELGIETLGPHHERACPFSVPIVFSSPEAMAEVRRALIEEHIYPAQLWTLDEPKVDGVSAETQDLAARILSIHCDARHERDDLDRVAAAIGACGEKQP